MKKNDTPNNIEDNNSAKNEDDETHSQNISKFKSKLVKSLKKKNNRVENKQTEIVHNLEDAIDEIEDKNEDGENISIFNVKIKRKPDNIRDKSNTFCNICDLKFSKRLLFLSHCSSVHDVKFKGIKSGQGIVIPKLIERPPWTLDQRQSANTTTTSSYVKASVPCSFCGKVFSNLSNKERHERKSCVKVDKKKIKDKEFKCNINDCDRQFSKSGYLIKHQLNEHE